MSVHVCSSPCVANTSENVKPIADNSVPMGMSPELTRYPPSAYSASRDRWIAPLLSDSNSAFALANPMPASYESATYPPNRSRSKDSPANTRTVLIWLTVSSTAIAIRCCASADARSIFFDCRR